MTSFRVSTRPAWLVIAALAAGCGKDGPELASVEGVVVLDGQPLADATVLFTPVAAGRPSAALTDASGHYELIYTGDRDGALPGEHTVRVSTFVGGDPDSGRVGAPERVPAKYNEKTELKRIIEPDGSVVDLELDSRGKIIEPTG